eukprot:XP_012815661.2 PREDICTED: zinc metalloproteinase-disintegrin-like bothrojarin-1 [Xenopus tropicalis]
MVCGTPLSQCLGLMSLLFPPQVCYNNECVSVETAFGLSGCEGKCSGNGVTHGEIMQEFLLNTQPSSLGDVPDKTNFLRPNVCGNKLTEVGEECDCGTVQECKDQCCDAATCKLKPGAQCAEGECCSNCKIKAAGEVCRERNDDDCDLEDVCDGKSPWCPSDRFQANGAPCGKGEGYCYNGTCPTMQRQCTSLWGDNTLVGEDLCFNKNMEGTDYGHCKNVGSTYIPCKPENVMCGVLYCNSDNEYPTVPGRVAVTGECKALLAPEGMVQNGIKCGDGKASVHESSYR